MNKSLLRKKIKSILESNIQSDGFVCDIKETTEEILVAVRAEIEKKRPKSKS